ncbi:MAG: aa3-type cytochrome c oxidase subunit IV [Pseudomonadota bacterium]
MDIEEQKKTWVGFVKFSKNMTIFIIVLIALLGIFLI